MKNTIKIEVTDTFGGESNYSWVKRYELDYVENQTDLQLIRRVKKVIGWTGLKCKTTRLGGSFDIEIRPLKICQVCFIMFEQ